MNEFDLHNNLIRKKSLLVKKDKYDENRSTDIKQRFTIRCQDAIQRKEATQLTRVIIDNKKQERTVKAAKRKRKLEKKREHELKLYGRNAQVIKNLVKVKKLKGKAKHNVFQLPSELLYKDKNLCE